MDASKSNTTVERQKKVLLTRAFQIGVSSIKKQKEEESKYNHVYQEMAKPSSSETEDIKHMPCNESESMKNKTHSFVESEDLLSRCSAKSKLNTKNDNLSCDKRLISSNDHCITFNNSSIQEKVASNTSSDTITSESSISNRRNRSHRSNEIVKRSFSLNETYSEDFHSHKLVDMSSGVKVPFNESSSKDIHSKKHVDASSGVEQNPRRHAVRANKNEAKSDNRKSFHNIVNKENNTEVKKLQQKKCTYAESHITNRAVSSESRKMVENVERNRKKISGTSSRVSHGLSAKSKQLLRNILINVKNGKRTSFVDDSSLPYSENSVSDSSSIPSENSALKSKQMNNDSKQANVSAKNLIQRSYSCTVNMNSSNDLFTFPPLEIISDVSQVQNYNSGLMNAECLTSNYISPPEPNSFVKEHELFHVDSTINGSYIRPPVNPNSFDRSGDLEPIQNIDSKVVNMCFPESSQFSSQLDNSLESKGEFAVSTQEDLQSCEDDDDMFMLESKHAQKLSNFILSVQEEEGIETSIAHVIKKDIEFSLKRKCFDGCSIIIYGSYRSELAIKSSDINFALHCENASKIPKGFMKKIHTALSDSLAYKGYHFLRFEDQYMEEDCKICFGASHFRNDAMCQLICLKNNVKDNYVYISDMIKRLCSYNGKVKGLILAARKWADICELLNPEEGKLNSLAITLMVIHFLQHLEKPILPIVNVFEYKSYKTIPKISSEKAPSLADLWLSFLKYYYFSFNWQEHIITITNMDPVLKSSKSWERSWIAIEEPFSQQNVASSVKSLYMLDFIMACFRAAFDYFIQPPTVANQPSGNSHGDNDWNYSFKKSCAGVTCPLICEECEDLGTLCEDCEEKYAELKNEEFPPMDDNFLSVVDGTLRKVYDDYHLPEKNVNGRKVFLEDLERYVQKKFRDAKLFLFGSSVNGFGFRTSDLDICMTFKNQEYVAPHRCKGILLGLLKHLRQNEKYEGVLFYPAQIPIVTFYFVPTGWRGDISLYNMLAIYNSRLLHTYSLIDERCRILGCALKLLAKRACIADTASKTLSSYSYLIMVIHYLQQTKPPVLPVLQKRKLLQNLQVPDKIVENCNVSFVEDMTEINKLLKDTNTESVASLWLGLLDYYTTNVDSDMLISIRSTKKSLPQGKFKKGVFLNIQDPFIIEKNLASLVPRRKGEEITKVLLRAKKLFRTPFKEVPQGKASFKDYLFSPSNLTGRSLNEAECNFCGKMGHTEEKCPRAVFHKKRHF